MIFFRNGDRFLIKSFSVILNFIRLIILGNIIYFFVYFKVLFYKKKYKEKYYFFTEVLFFNLS